MSNTYKHKELAKNKIDSYYTCTPEEWDAYMKSFEKVYGYNYYSNTPHWWHNEFHERPMRRQVKRALRDVSLANMGEEVILPVFKKPHIYYW